MYIIGFPEVESLYLSFPVISHRLEHSAKHLIGEQLNDPSRWTAEWFRIHTRRTECWATLLEHSDQRNKIVVK